MFYIGAEFFASVYNYVTGPLVGARGHSDFNMATLGNGVKLLQISVA